MKKLWIAVCFLPLILIVLSSVMIFTDLDAFTSGSIPASFIVLQSVAAVGLLTGLVAMLLHKGLTPKQKALWFVLLAFFHSITLIGLYFKVLGPAPYPLAEPPPES